MGESVYRNIENNFVNESYGSYCGFEIIGGTNKIILSAPHSVSHNRKEKVKLAETRTGLIVKLLAVSSDCHVVYKTKNLGDDANYDEECKFKEETMNFIVKNDINLLIDFHLSSVEREYCIDIGTGCSLNILGREDILICIKAGFESIYKDVRIDDTFTAKYKHTVSATISREIKIPAFQIEVNWKIVDDYKKTKIFNNCMLAIIDKLEAMI